MVWKISRVTTSKMIERRSGAGSAPPASQHRRPAAGGLLDRVRAGAWTRRIAAPVRRARKIRLATPVAATTSTAISPMVSQARMSTRVTLTMFWPPPNAYRRLGEGRRDRESRCARRWRPP